MSRHRARPAPRPARRADRPVRRLGRRLTRQRTAVALAVVAGLTVGVGGAGTYAFWSDQANVTTGDLAAGALDLRVDDNQAAGLGTGWTKTAITFSGRTPSEYETYPLTFRNVGNPTGTYTLSVLRGGSWTYLDDAVVVQAFTGTAVDDPTAYPERDTCSGASLGPEQLVSTANPFTLTTAPRTLVGGAQETLCLRVGIATAAGNGNQSKTGTLVFRATLTQVT